MDEISVMIALVSVPAALGAIADRLMLNRTKGQIHNKLLAAWDWLDERSISELAGWVARLGVGLVESTVRSSKTLFSAISLSIVFSVSLTISAITIAWYAHSAAEGVNAFVVVVVGLGAALTASCAAIFTFRHPALFWGVVLGTAFHLHSSESSMMMFIIVAANYPFDAATVLVTYRCLQRIASDDDALRRALWIAVDFIIACFCATLCFLALLALVGIEPLLAHGGGALVLVIVEVLSGGMESQFHAALVAFSFTTLIPTALYMSVLLFLILGKPVLSFGKTYTEYFLERATEVGGSKELVVFTLLGLHFSAIAVIATAIYKITKIGAG